MELLKLLIVEDDVASLELMTEVFRSLKADVRPRSGSHNQISLEALFDRKLPKGDPK